MKAAWQHFHSVFSKAECDSIISHCLEILPRQATVGHGGAAVVNEAVRKTKVRWLTRTDPFLQPLFDKIRVNGHMANANAFGMDIAEFWELQMLEYNGGNQGHYNRHMDLNWFPEKDKETPFQRKLSCVMQLSDPNSYKGGRLELFVPNGHALTETTFKNPGDMIFFPSFVEHQAHPVTEGVRFCITAWFHGQNFR